MVFTPSNLSHLDSCINFNAENLKEFRVFAHGEHPLASEMKALRITHRDASTHSNEIDDKAFISERKSD